MAKYYFAIGILGIFTIAVFIAGVFVVNPSSKRDTILDENRLQDFEKLRSLINNYYSSNSNLPKNLDEVSEEGITDPQTQKQYEYKPNDNEFNYRLCTVFSTDTTKTVQENYYDKESAIYKKHKKGYDCMEFKITPSSFNSRNRSGYTIVQPTVRVKPAGAITGPRSGKVNETLSFSAVANSTAGDLAKAEIWVAKTDRTNPTEWGCNPVAVEGNFCMIFSQQIIGSSESFSGRWEPKNPGTYYVGVNVYAFDSKKCSSDPFGTGSNTCGSNSYIPVVVTDTQTTSPTSQLQLSTP
jgi:hypothetical protein